MRIPGFTAERLPAPPGHRYAATLRTGRPGGVQPARASDTLATCEAHCTDGACRYRCEYGFCRWVCTKRLKGPIRRFEMP